MMIVFFVSTVYTKSRGGSLGMVIAVCLSVLISKHTLKRKAIKAAFIGILLLAFVAYGVTVILSREDISSYSGQDASGGDRILCWKIALMMFKDHPLFGVGWGQYPDLIRSYGHNKKLPAHNTPLSVLAETGIFGLIFFLSIIYLTIKQLWMMQKKWKDDKDKTILFILAQGTFVSLVCFCINTMFSVKDHDPIYWAALYIAGSLCVIYHREEALENEKKSA
jgi:O-antigen ligase